MWQAADKYLAAGSGQLTWVSGTCKNIGGTLRVTGGVLNVLDASCVTANFFNLRRIKPPTCLPPTSNSFPPQHAGRPAPSAGRQSSLEYLTRNPSNAAAGAPSSSARGTTPPLPSAAATAAAAGPAPKVAYGTLTEEQLRFTNLLSSFLEVTVKLPLLAPGAQALDLRRLYMEVRIRAPHLDRFWFLLLWLGQFRCNGHWLQVLRLRRLYMFNAGSGAPHLDIVSSLLHSLLAPACPCLAHLSSKRRWGATAPPVSMQLCPRDFIFVNLPSLTIVNVPYCFTLH